MFQYNQIYYFRYMPKGYGKLPIFDQLPLVLPLLVRGPVMMGINLHWIPGPLRYKFIQWTIALYNKGGPQPPQPTTPMTTIEGDVVPTEETTAPTQPAPIRSTFHLWYRIVKATPAIAFAVMGVRKYYIGRCANVQVITPEYWNDLHLLWMTKYRARYLRRSNSTPGTMV